jgi:predicted nuclease with TOPRIM domain
MVMKSAYELAMERLQKGSPIVSLTEDQKKQLAEIDSTFRARIAEREVFLQDQITKAQMAGNVEEVAALQKQLASELSRLREDWENKKEKLRAGFAR